MNILEKNRKEKELAEVELRQILIWQDVLTKKAIDSVAAPLSEVQHLKRKYDESEKRRKALVKKINKLRGEA